MTKPGENCHTFDNEGHNNDTLSSRIHGNGENLSGGQRQRISLARAAYKNGSIYVMDDPLSAVDPRLRHAIFKDVIGHDGILKKKTRLVVVNDISFVNYMDRLLFMQGRSIADTGSYNELKERNNVDLDMWSVSNGDDTENIDHLFKGEVNACRECDNVVIIMV